MAFAATFAGVISTIPEVPGMTTALAAAGYNVLSADFYGLGDCPDGATFAQFVVAENL